MKQTALVKKLDKVFSQYIRLRDSKDGEVGACVTCSKVEKIKEMDCGHFQSRDRANTRWDDKNANLQCTYCNKYRSGEQYLHGVIIDVRHGKGTAERLHISAKIAKKWHPHELALLLKFYEQALEVLLKKYGIKRW